MPLNQQDINHIIAHTDHLWRGASNKKIFITGGTGFLGKWLLESFLAANYRFRLNAELTVLSRNYDLFLNRYPYFRNLPELKFVQGDVIEGGVPTDAFDFIIHAATEASAKINEENPLLMVDTIVSGTRNMLEFARRCGAEKFLLVSSGAVYGCQPSSVSHIPEEHCSAPDITKTISAYGEGKRVAELLCAIYQKQYGIDVKIARCFAFVGPYLDLNIHFAVGNFIRDALQGKAIEILGDGTPLRSYLYAADWAIWIWVILFSGRTGRAYNVGSDQPVSISQLANTISRCFKSHPEVKIAKMPVFGNPVEQYVPSVERAHKELSLDCWIKLDDAIKRTIEFYENCK